MAREDQAHAEALRTFQAAISGMELAELRVLAGDLMRFGGSAALTPVRPDLRRPPFSEPTILRVRVDVDGASPPIWRRLDVRADLTLDAVHQVLQVAFDWSDYHLHRFSLGGHPFARTSQLFLCPYDVEEAEFDDEGGIPTSEVRLDETLQEPGDVMSYLYDYGDGWELTIRLEEVLPAPTGAPSAAAVSGRRAAPPEDSGGGTDAASIALQLDDPAHFDLEELNKALQGPYFVLRDHGMDQRLVDLTNRLSHTALGQGLAARALTLVSEPTTAPDDEMLSSLGAHAWYLDRARGGGIQLTSAGYLKPADVQAASLVLPAMSDWIGKNNRESLAPPLVEFRASLQAMGLLRKRKGSLLLTRLGAAAQRDRRRLWEVLTERIIPDASGFERDATLLLLVHVATSAGREVPLRPVVGALAQLGWRARDGRRLPDQTLHRLRAFQTLTNLTDQQPEVGHRRTISPAAAALARAALRP